MFSDMVYYNKDLHPKPMREYIPEWYKNIPNYDYPKNKSNSNKYNKNKKMDKFKYLLNGLNQNTIRVKKI